LHLTRELRIARGFAARFYLIPLQVNSGVSQRTRVDIEKVKFFRRSVVLGAMALVTGCREPQGVVTSDSHVDSILTRDLNAYFRTRQGQPVLLHYTYLRSGPTITGIAFPKYYVWVRVEPVSGGTPVEGAARIALGDSAATVTNFLEHDSGSAAPPGLDSVFPAPVASSIRRLYWK